ncbi:MAG: bacteriophage abortive infection AbiH family protein, partial [Acidobacteria bacterium]|nr:bacteriophage abortive infection AbiH family protein [Acidobacteriota bacterium]
MNRILLIGNGFDLAHGLKTGYNDFIAWFWMEQLKKINDTKFLEWEPVSRVSETTHYIHRNNRYFDVKFIGTKNQLNECCKQEETK